MSYFSLLCMITIFTGLIHAKKPKKEEKQYPWFSTLQFNQNKLPEAYHWMKNIKSSTKISSLAIPGTHDTCTDGFKKITLMNKLIIENYTQTQSWPLRDQLKAGIRYIDIRPGTDGNIYHGAYQTKSTFNEVFNTVAYFLSLNPSEGIIMRVKMSVKEKCKSVQCRNSNIIKVLDQHSSILLLIGRVPLLGEMRGKILLITDKFKYKNALIWGSSLMMIQDKYKMIGESQNEIKKKNKVILEYLIKSKRKKEFIINHCSGAGPPFITIKGIAKHTNKVSLNEKGFSGIIAMDYPGEGIIQHIINQNNEFEVLSTDKR